MENKKTEEEEEREEGGDGRQEKMTLKWKGV